MRIRGSILRAGLLAALLPCSAGATRAAEKVAVIGAGENGPPVLKRAGPDKPWRLAGGDEALAPGDEVLGGMGASVVSANGAVRATMAGDIAGHSPFPILETSLICSEPKGADLAVAMDRGRVDLVNTKKSGAARALLTVHGKTGAIELPEPGDRVAVEIYGRWPKGTRFTKTPKETDAPALAILLIAVKGDVTVKGPERTFTLQAPPGTSMVLIDDLGDATPHVYKLDALPAWVNGEDRDKLDKARSAGKRFKELAGAKSIGEALDELVTSDDPVARRLALIVMGATDDLKRLCGAVVAAKQPDVWDNGVVVLRHWIGRCPGQDLKLYKSFTTKMPEAEAEAALQLLHSFSAEDLQRPDTYQGLIDYLDCDRLALRGLAHWHLVRLVPEGRTIEFDLVAGHEKRAAALKAWRALVPPGTVPGRPAKS
jgi:hypothetical protein